jgi:hypothetical protein
VAGCRCQPDLVRAAARRSTKNSQVSVVGLLLGPLEGRELGIQLLLQGCVRDSVVRFPCLTIGSTSMSTRGQAASYAACQSVSQPASQSIHWAWSGGAPSRPYGHFIVRATHTPSGGPLLGLIVNPRL